MEIQSNNGNLEPATFKNMIELPISPEPNELLENVLKWSPTNGYKLVLMSDSVNGQLEEKKIYVDRPQPDKCWDWNLKLALVNEVAPLGLPFDSPEEIIKSKECLRCIFLSLSERGDIPSVNIDENKKQFLELTFKMLLESELTLSPKRSECLIELFIQYLTPLTPDNLQLLKELARKKLPEKISDSFFNSLLINGTANNRKIIDQILSSRNLSAIQRKRLSLRAFYKFNKQDDEGHIYSYCLRYFPDKIPNRNQVIEEQLKKTATQAKQKILSFIEIEEEQEELTVSNTLCAIVDAYKFLKAYDDDALEFLSDEYTGKIHCQIIESKTRSKYIIFCYRISKKAFYGQYEDKYYPCTDEKIVQQVKLLQVPGGSDINKIKKIFPSFTPVSRQALLFYKLRFAFNYPEELNHYHDDITDSLAELSFDANACFSLITAMYLGLQSPNPENQYRITGLFNLRDSALYAYTFLSSRHSYFDLKGHNDLMKFANQRLPMYLSSTKTIPYEPPIKIIKRLTEIKEFTEKTEFITNIITKLFDSSENIRQNAVELLTCLIVAKPSLLVDSIDLIADTMTTSYEKNMEQSYCYEEVCLIIHRLSAAIISQSHDEQDMQTKAQDIKTAVEHFEKLNKKRQELTTQIQTTIEEIETNANNKKKVTKELTTHQNIRLLRELYSEEFSIIENYSSIILTIIQEYQAQKEPLKKTTTIENMTPIQDECADLEERSQKTNKEYSTAKETIGKEAMTLYIKTIEAGITVRIAALKTRKKNESTRVKSLLEQNNTDDRILTLLYNIQGEQNGYNSSLCYLESRDQFNKHTKILEEQLEHHSIRLYSEKPTENLEKTYIHLLPSKEKVTVIFQIKKEMFKIESQSVGLIHFFNLVLSRLLHNKKGSSTHYDVEKESNLGDFIKQLVAQEQFLAEVKSLLSEHEFEMENLALSTNVLRPQGG